MADISNPGGGPPGEPGDGSNNDDGVRATIGRARLRLQEIRASADADKARQQGEIEQYVRQAGYWLLVPIVLVLLTIILTPVAAQYLGFQVTVDPALLAWAQGLLATIAGGAAAYLFSAQSSG